MAARPAAKKAPGHQNRELSCYAICALTEAFLLRVLDGSLGGGEQTGKFSWVPIEFFMSPSITQEMSKEKDNFEVYSEIRLPLLRLVLEPRYSFYVTPLL